MLKITDSAVKEFKKLIDESKAQDSVVRVFASGGGCCGPSYGVDIVEKSAEGDTLIEKEGLKVFIDASSAEGLDSATIDYIEAGPDKGFTILGLQESGGCC